MSEPVDVLAIGPGCVPPTPAVVPGPGAAPPAADDPGVEVPADASDEGAASASPGAPGAPSMMTFAGSRPSDAGKAGERRPVPMTTAMMIAGPRTTATTLADRI
jgi:hypothetical protein